jgi:zinc-ribbon domain
MAFCNSCGATLADGTKFCNKCGAVVSGAPATATATPGVAPQAAPTKGGSSALKIVLIVIAVIVGIGILGAVTVGVVGYRIAKSSHVRQNGEDVKIDTPFGSVETSKDASKIASQLGVDIYPGASAQNNGAATASFGPVRTVTAVFSSSDSVDKVCSFYKEKFPNPMTSTSDDNHCTIVSNDHNTSTTIAVESSGDGSKFTISTVTKK